MGTVHQWHGSWMKSVMSKHGSTLKALDTMLILVAKILCVMSSPVKGVAMNALLVLFQIATVIVFQANILQMESAIWGNDSIRVFQLISVVNFLVAIWVTAKVHVGMIWDMRDLMI